MKITPSRQSYICCKWINFFIQILKENAIFQTAWRYAKQCEKRKFQYEWCLNYREMLFEENGLECLFVCLATNSLFWRFIILEYFLNFRQFFIVILN